MASSLQRGLLQECCSFSGALLLYFYWRTSSVQSHVSKHFQASFFGAQTLPFFAEKFSFHVRERKRVRKREWTGVHVQTEQMITGDSWKEKVKRVLRSRSFFIYALFIGEIAFCSLAFGLMESLSVIDALYFSVTTVATIGYGDIEPQSPFGLVLLIGFLFFILGAKIYTLCIITFISNEKKKESAIIYTFDDRKVCCILLLFRFIQLKRIIKTSR